MTVKLTSILRGAVVASLIVAGSVSVAPSANAATMDSNFELTLARQDNGGYGINLTGIGWAGVRLVQVMEGDQYIEGWCIQPDSPSPSVGTGGGAPTYTIDQTRTAQLPASAVWLVQNSWPNVTIDEMGAQSGLGAGLDPRAVKSAIQMAIWHLVNGVPVRSAPQIMDLGGVNGSGTAGNAYEDQAAAMYTWLVQQATANAGSVGNVETPVKIDNSKADFVDGRVGPITITGAFGSKASITSVNGGTLEYADGTAVDLSNVDTSKQLFVKVSGTSGSISVTASGTTTVREGVALVGSTQDLISVTKWGSVTSSDSVSFQWDSGQPAPTPTATPTKDTMPTPTVSTLVSSQTSQAGASISDTVVVSGLVSELNGNPVTTTVDVTLHGPVPAVDGSCEKASWTGAPVAGTWTMSDVTNGSHPDQGSYTIPADSPDNVCYSYSEKLTSTEQGGTPVVVDHQVGQVTQTTIVQPKTPPTTVPAPEVSTIVSDKVIGPGGTISDDVQVSGVDAHNQVKGVVTDVRGTLWGPLPASNGTCDGLDWSKAPVAATFTIPAVQDGTYNNKGQFGIPQNAADDSCYTYSEKLFSYPVGGSADNATEVADHAPGQESQTTIVKKPAAPAAETPPTISTIASDSVVKPGATITDSVIVGGIDTSTGATYTVSGALYGPVKANMDAPEGQQCKDLDWSNAPKATTIEPFKVTEDGRIDGVGSYTVPSDIVTPMCYTYGETLVKVAANGGKTVVNHLPGKPSQTVFIYDERTMSRGDQLDHNGSKTGTVSLLKPRPLGDTGAGS